MSKSKSTKRDFEQERNKRNVDKVKKYELKIKEMRKEIVECKDIIINLNQKLEEYALRNKSFKERNKNLEEVVQKLSVDLTLYKNTESGRMKEEIKSLTAENSILRKMNDKFLSLSFLDRIKLLFL